MIGSEVLKILETAAAIDGDFKVFGASKHKYRLNAPVSADFVRNAQEQYGFTLPEDYFRFITEIGDGGAGEDYGLYSFKEYITKNNPGYEKERQGLKLPLEIRPMTDEDGKYSGLAPEFFKSNREKCFFDPHYYDDDNDGFSDGCLTLGTRGCQYDFVLALSGEHRGRVFDIDNEGGFVLIADSFEEFYSRWLDKISNVDRLKGQIEFWTNLRKH
ncbi:MAG: SMI1/KNR4 family protein [Ruminococcaceae bacterium]|nr:SMI1/KNR4 family protein [Oscillospiraceae bacterium]